MKGRKPIPTHLKVLTGNPGKQKLPKGEPEPETNIPEPPNFLDDYAMEDYEDASLALERINRKNAKFMTTEELERSLGL